MEENTMVETVYTHHQKFVIADAEVPGSNLHRIVAYIGGIDLTDGRFYTPEYPLFNFYQNCTPGATLETDPGNIGTIFMLRWRGRLPGTFLVTLLTGGANKLKIRLAA